MSKFYCLIFKSDMSIQKVWMSNDDVLKYIIEQPDAKIYRCASDQIAIAMGVVTGIQHGLELLVWQDMTPKDKAD